MGLLRIILALAVVVGHSTKTLFGYELIYATVSVQAFYVISGFYMALILNEKYTGPGSYKLFITNRFLRLFPTYWAIFGLSLLVGWLALISQNGGMLNNFAFLYHKLHKGSLIFFLLSNIFIFGQDLCFYLGINPETGRLFFTNNFWGTSPPQVNSVLVVPQAWSLSIELMFYVIAPFVVRRKLVTICAIIGASLACRVWLYSQGFNFDPWSYRFFPNELALFLSGAISYKMYRRIRLSKIPGYALVGCGLIPLAATLYFPYFIPGNLGWMKIFAYLFVLTLTLPFLFLLTGRVRFDRFIGELSYPIYLIHIMLITLFSIYLKQWSEYEKYRGLVACLGSILASVLIYLVLIRPLDAYRAKRIAKQAVRPQTSGVSLIPGQSNA
jgi:peptidoglycan/LPS O-acetylase OafA/YrhL